jgi:hypothetical protein
MLKSNGPFGVSAVIRGAVCVSGMQHRSSPQVQFADTQECNSADSLLLCFVEWLLCSALRQHHLLGHLLRVLLLLEPAALRQQRYCMAAHDTNLAMCMRCRCSGCAVVIAATALSAAAQVTAAGVGTTSSTTGSGGGRERGLSNVR